jgi:uncharacterized damage-inducible protein DinB
MKTLICAMTMMMGVMMVSAQSKPAPDNSYTGNARSRWNAIKRNISASAKAMPEADYAFKPTADVRTFGQLFGHLANEHYMFCSDLKGEANPQKAVDFEKKTAKADLVKAIDDSIAYCDAAYASVKDDPKTITPLKPGGDTPFSLMLGNITHDSEHYGNIVTYLRMKGIVPPSSQPSR